MIIGNIVNDITSLQMYRSGRWSPVTLLRVGRKLGVLEGRERSSSAIISHLCRMDNIIIAVLSGLEQQLNFMSVTCIIMKTSIDIKPLNIGTAADHAGHSYQGSYSGVGRPNHGSSI